MRPLNLFALGWVSAYTTTFAFRELWWEAFICAAFAALNGVALLDQRRNCASGRTVDP